MTLTELQDLIRVMYSSKDADRGIDGTFMWFMEEVGELATALREDDRQELGREFADVMAWLVTLANIADIDLSAAIAEKYGTGCPGCGEMICRCGTSAKP